MSVLVILVIVSIAVAVAFLGGFIWAVRSGQYEDTCTPSMRVLLDDREEKSTPAKISIQDKNINP
jgi:cbb3-type cytochrome oxidase maturation protein